MWKDSGLSEVSEELKRLVLTVYTVSIVSALCESVVAVGGRSRLIDLTGIFFDRPFWLLIFSAWGVFVLHKVFAVSWPVAIKSARAYVPLVFIGSLVNIAVLWMGFESIVPSFVNVLDVPVSLLTFGWWPRLLASPGTLVTILATGVVLGIQIFRKGPKLKSIIYALLVWFAGAFGLLLLPSIVSWAIVSTDASPLNAGPNVLSRAWVALSQEGYWWHAVFDRFPGVVEGEAESSVRFLQLTIGWLVLVFAGLKIFSRQFAGSLRALIAWFKPARAIFFLTAAFFGLWLGRVAGGVFFVRAVDGVAWLLFVVTLLATWGVSVWRNDLHDRESDVASGRTDRPLVSGAASLRDFAIMGKGLGLIALIGGWLLGWPVLLPLFSFLLLQEALVMPGLRWKERSFGGLVLGLSFVSVAISGAFFSLRTASVPMLRPGLWLALLAFYLLQSFPKALRWSPRLLQVLSLSLRLSPRMLIPLALALGYLFVPLFTGWNLLWWIAGPCAVVALLPLLGSGRWDERKIVGWQTAFILIGFFLLSVRPSP